MLATMTGTKSPNEIDLAAIRRNPEAPATAQRVYGALAARVFELRVMIAHYPKIASYPRDYIAVVDIMEAMISTNTYASPHVMVEVTSLLRNVLGQGCVVCGHRLAYRGAEFCSTRCSESMEHTG